MLICISSNEKPNIHIKYMAKSWRNSRIQTKNHKTFSPYKQYVEANVES